MDVQVGTGGSGPVGNVQVAGGTLPVVVAGSGRPVVLVHGALLRDCMRPLAGRLPEFRTVRYHRRGYGDATAAVTGSIGHEADDCAAVIEQVAGGPAHLVGWSQGGAVAMETASRRPDLVASLHLLEPALLEGATPGAAADAESDLDAVFLSDLPAHESWTPPSVDLGPRPVLYVGGDRWEPLGGEIRARARGLVPGMREVTVGGAGHEFAATRADEVAVAVRATIGLRRTEPA